MAEGVVVQSLCEAQGKTLRCVSESVESGHPGLLMIPEGSPDAQSSRTPEQPQGPAEDPQWSSVY